MEMSNDLLDVVSSVAMNTDFANAESYAVLLDIADKMQYLINLVFVFLVIYTLINVIKYFYVLLSGFTRI